MPVDYRYLALFAFWLVIAVRCRQHGLTRRYWPYMAFIGMAALTLAVRLVAESASMPPAVLAELRDHSDSRFEFSADGKDWRLELKCRGRVRLFLWVHAWYMAEFAWQRLPEEKRFPFVWWHAACLTLLSCLAAVKILVWPSVDDVAALVGFDTITAEKLTGIKAALSEQIEDVSKS